MHTATKGTDTVLARLNGWLNGLAVGAGLGVQAHLDARARMDRLATLNRSPDGELDRLGIARNEIARHVFTDVWTA
ncbi:MAG: hypothetical protein AcusKO_36980 [Acuticoccus sp.]